MKIALKDGQLLIKDADSAQFAVIKSWGKMKWSRSEQMICGPADRELLNKLSGMVRLPPHIEAERQRLNEIQEAVDVERLNEHPVPMYPYPVRMKLYAHQVRAANMALMTFGLINPMTKRKGKENV